MIIRLRSKRRSSRSSGSSYLLRLVVFFVACFGTYVVTEISGRNEHFTRITTGTLLYLPQVRHNAAGAQFEDELDAASQASWPPTKPPVDSRIRDSLFQLDGICPERVWDSLLEEGKALLAALPTRNVTAMEVGMYRALQCMQAARAGLAAHCVEPSPHNFQRVNGVVRRSPPEIKNRIQLYQKAAGATSGDILNFSAAGGTGDHVGEFDTWNMKVGKTTDEELQQKVGPTVQVSSIKLDDIIQNVLQGPDDRVFLLKVDTQGYEPSVFAGLNKSVFEEQRVDFILFEYWPKGIDLLSSSGGAGSDVEKSCKAAHLLERLQRAGYILYALPNTAHPKAPKAAKGAMKGERAPMQNPKVNCAYYYELEERFPDPIYKMGYWSDILAVAPNATLVALPATELGQLLQQEEQLQRLAQLRQKR